MECLEPHSIRDEELLAYLAGEKVRPFVEQHLALCPRCSQQLAIYRRIENTLTHTLYRRDCPPNLALGEYQLGILDKKSTGVVKKHLATCNLCATELATLTQFLAHDPVLAVPQNNSATSSASQNTIHPVQTAKRVFEELHEQVVASGRRIIATLLPPQPHMVYQRGDATSTVWPRRYMAEGVSISLQVEPESAGRGLLQVIGFVNRQGERLEALEGIQVQLASIPDTVYTQTIDDLGNFVFSGVLQDTYTLELHFPENTIVVENLLVTTA